LIGKKSQKLKELQEAWNHAGPLDRLAFFYEILALSKIHTRDLAHNGKITQNPRPLVKRLVQAARAISHWNNVKPD